MSDTMFVFSDPHPGGIMGCSSPLPKDIKAAIDQINGTAMSLDDALRIINLAKPKGMEVEAHSNEEETGGWIRLQQGSVQTLSESPCHVWKLIEYLEETK